MDFIRKDLETCSVSGNELLTLPAYNSSILSGRFPKQSRNGFSLPAIILYTSEKIFQISVARGCVSGVEHIDGCNIGYDPKFCWSCWL